MKKIIITLGIFLAFLLPSCSDKHDDEPQPPVSSTVRTVLVYMVANNSLGRYGYDKNDLNEMCQAAREGQLGESRWVVYCHPYGETPKLMELDESGEFTTLKEYSTETLSVSIDRMKEVLADVRKFTPAADYGIVLWSHATGWLQNGVTETSKLRSFGEDNGRYMNITSLAEALSGAGMSFIYADCCYMGCVEVAYQLRDCADFFVASVAELPADGMDYSQNMKCLTARNPDLIGAACNTYNLYEKNNFTNPNNSWCTMSVIDLRMMPALAERTAAIYKSGAYPAKLNPQTFTAGYNYYFDLTQFVENTSADAALLADWNNVMQQTVLYEQATPYIIGGIRVNTHCGLSTFILNSADAQAIRNYRQLDWYNDVARFQPLP